MQSAQILCSGIASFWIILKPDFSKKPLAYVKDNICANLYFLPSFIHSWTSFFPRSRPLNFFETTRHLKDFVDVICKAKGGSGAVREMIEHICKEDSLEEEFLNAWI